MQPHFLLLIGEDTGLHPRCYGNPYASTPNLDRLATQGTRFTHAVSTCPVSAPSRSSIVTGVHPWSLGTHQMRSTLLHPPRLFTHELRDAGYFVNWHTKTDFNFDPPYPPAADPFCDAAEDWVDALAAGKLNDRPTLLYRNFGVTHESTMWDRLWDEHYAARRERLANEHLLAPEQRHDPAAAPVPPYLPDTPATRRCIADYFDALSIQDHQIGRVLAALDASGRADQTVVIYLTDHGRGLPREKRWCYEAGLHLPLLVRGRAAAGQLQPGTLDDQLVSWVDIAPTILNLAGVASPRHYQGRAFLGRVSTPPRRFAFAGRDRMGESFDHVRVARSDRFHYIRNTFPKLPYAQRNTYMERMPVTQDLRRLHAAGQLRDDAAVWMASTKPAEEFYDWRTDPHMLHNLAADPAHAAALAEHRDALDQHLAQVGDLGHGPERDLINRGLVKDRLAEYHARVEPLPPEQQIGPARTIVEWQDAAAL